MGSFHSCGSTRTFEISSPLRGSISRTEAPRALVSVQTVRWSAGDCLDPDPWAALRLEERRRQTGLLRGSKLVVEFEDQDEVDRHWFGLIKDGGEESMCGWLKDRFGVSWQILPSRLAELLSDPDPDRSARAKRRCSQ